MNYSKSTRKERQSKYVRRLLLSWLVVFLIGILFGFTIRALVDYEKDYKTPEVEPEQTNFFISEVQEAEQIITNISSIVPITEPVKKEEPENEYLGKWRITAYCSCEKCCGEWAKNRPNGIVVGAAGVELKAGVSVASPLPLGTRVYIEGIGEYVVQDRTASWVAEKYNNEIIDIYFDNHEAACDFGLQYLDIYKIESEDENND